MSAKQSIISTIQIVVIQAILQRICALPVPQTDITNVSCFATLDSLGTYSPDSVFTVRCPEQCLSSRPFHVEGTNNYTPSSNLCVAGIHSGVITKSGGVMKITVQNKWINPVGSNRNGVRSLGGFAAHTTFIPKAVNPPASSSSANPKANLGEPTSSSSSASTTTTPTSTLTTTAPTATLTTTPPTTTSSTTSTTTVASTLSTTPTPITPTTSTAYSTTTPQVHSSSSKQPGKTGDSLIESDADSPTEISKFRNNIKSTTASPSATESTTSRTVKIQAPNSVFTSTVENDDKTSNSNLVSEETSNVYTLLLWICGGVTFLLLILLLVCFLRKRSRFGRSRISHAGKRKPCRSSGGLESCVCYVAVDSSVQALLNDPETCERPCELRDRLQETESLPESNCHSGPQCDECTGEKCASQYDF
uniref:Cell wall integrity and stress response component 2 n=1 Tax=Phallusia mammillata TaxID=59560 RepID=A0A6F9DVY9_9ASCI|nr:cell wall integrity and stress response component 2 [Phallusia mammillata]